MKISAPVLLVSLTLLSHSPAATVVIDNMTPGTQGFAASLSGPAAEVFPFDPFPDRQVAFSFISGPGAVALSQLTFIIFLGDVYLSPIEATLSTGSAVPGGVAALSLGTVTPAAAPAGQVLSISPAVPIPLAPSTEYWVHFTVPAGAGLYSILNNNNPVLSSGFSLGNTWYYDPDSSWTDITSGPQARVRLSVEAVPEPGVALLGMLAGLAVLCRRSRVN